MNLLVRSLSGVKKTTYILYFHCLVTVKNYQKSIVPLFAPLKTLPDNYIYFTYFPEFSLFSFQNTEQQYAIFFYNQLNPLSASDANSRPGANVACSGCSASYRQINKTRLKFFEREENLLQNGMLHFVFKLSF